MIFKSDSNTILDSKFLWITFLGQELPCQWSKWTCSNKCHQCHNATGLPLGYNWLLFRHLISMNEDEYLPSLRRMSSIQRESLAVRQFHPFFNRSGILMKGGGYSSWNTKLSGTSYTVHVDEVLKWKYSFQIIVNG